MDVADVHVLRQEQLRREQQRRRAPIKFCGECNNMLYPAENPTTRRLIYACRSCDQRVPATAQDGNMVYQRLMRHTVEERTQVFHDLGADPTLPRTSLPEHACPACAKLPTLFFQSKSNDPDAPDAHQLYFVCPACGNHWKEADGNKPGRE